jgi:hypothetical protein
MSSKSCCPELGVAQLSNRRQTRGLLAIPSVLLAQGFLAPALAAASGAPSWMHAQAGRPMPAYDAQTDAVLLYSETVLSVQPDGKMRRLDRKAYRILRPGGEHFGLLELHVDSRSRVISMRGWCIPASGQDFEVTESGAVESGKPEMQTGVLVGDLRIKSLQIPAALPGSIVGYEDEQELQPYQIADSWAFQDQVPVGEAHYTLALPPGWSYSAVWLNHADQAPVPGARNTWTWEVRDVSAIPVEAHMPPWHGIAGQMVVEPLEPNARGPSLGSWQDVGLWYSNLNRDRGDSSPELTQKVVELTTAEPTLLGKIRALAGFVQEEVRYVAIELGIGGYQPHPASAVFANRFGDCKDKATLLSAMLKAIGVDSYYLLINTERGSVSPATPPSLGFNHEVLAIQLPKDAQDPSLLARFSKASLDGLLVFDPTDERTPFGMIRGQLQSNYGLLIRPGGGELIELPKLPTATNAVRRSARLTLDATGTLRGDVQEIRVGEPAATARQTVGSAMRDTDQIKPVEILIAGSFATVSILKASAANLPSDGRPFEWNYTLEADGYAKIAGDLLLVRPRVMGTDARDFLETDEPRTQAIEFERPEHDTDQFEISLPAGYKLEHLPPPVNVNFGFASYQSRSELIGQTLRYTRSLEIRELGVPAEKARELREFYRTISKDERRLAVLKRIPP